MSLRARCIVAIVLLMTLQLMTGRARSAPLGVVMTSRPVWDPVRAETDPLAIPGAVLAATVEVANRGATAVDAGSLVLAVAMPVGAALVVGGHRARFEASGGGIGLTFRALGDPFDDVAFSDDGGATFDYTPAPGGNNADPAVTHVRFRCVGSLPAGGSTRIGFRLTIAAGDDRRPTET